MDRIARSWYERDDLDRGHRVLRSKSEQTDHMVTGEQLWCLSKEGRFRIRGRI